MMLKALPRKVSLIARMDIGQRPKCLVLVYVLNGRSAESCGASRTAAGDDIARAEHRDPPTSPHKAGYATCHGRGSHSAAVRRRHAGEDGCGHKS